MDQVGREFDTDLFAHTVELGRLYKPLEVFNINYNFIMNAFENDVRDRSRKMAHIRRNDLYVLGTDYDIDGFVFLKTLIRAGIFMPRDNDTVIFKHHTVEDIALADEISDKRVCGFIIYVCRCSDLLDNALIHDNYRVGH